MPNGKIELARRLVATLPQGQADLFNPWRDLCPRDVATNGPKQKLQRLALHLDCEATLILCGEAPGYQGCRHSGVAFTSERLLREGVIPRIPATVDRLTNRRRPYSEPSATIVWRTLRSLGVEQTTVLWNAVQLHPGRAGSPDCNRTPTAQELAYGKPGLALLVKAFPKAKLIAVGRKAEAQIHTMGIETAGAVRHPANGGSTLFAEQLTRILAGQSQ